MLRMVTLLASNPGVGGVVVTPGSSHRGWRRWHPRASCRSHGLTTAVGPGGPKVAAPPLRSLAPAILAATHSRWTSSPTSSSRPQVDSTSTARVAPSVGVRAVPPSGQPRAHAGGCTLHRAAW